jgi:archaemetzincin
MAELSRRAFCGLGLSALLAASCRGESKASPKPKTVRHPRPEAERPRTESGLDPFEFDPELFARKIPPQPGDWLDRFPEIHQTFEAYINSSPPRPTEQRKKIVLQPLGTFAADEQHLLRQVREHAELFFALPVELAKALPLPSQGRRQRKESGNSWVQHRTGTILERALLPRLPADAITYLGVTMADLYPQSSWNFVFGEASLDERVGVYSFARFLPRFTGERRPTPVKLLRRGLAVLSHEAGHMFGITHCVRYECLMNGSNSLDELDRQRATLCPNCLHKLAWNVGFDVRARYRALGDFYRRENLEDLARFAARRLESLG